MPVPSHPQYPNPQPHGLAMPQAPRPAPNGLPVQLKGTNKKRGKK